MLAVDTIPLNALSIFDCRSPIATTSQVKTQSAIGNRQSAMSFGFLVIRVLTAASAELLELQAIRSRLFVLRRHVIAALAIAALQYNVIAWHKSPIGPNSPIRLMGPMGPMGLMRPIQLLR